MIIITNLINEVCKKVKIGRFLMRVKGGFQLGVWEIIGHTASIQRNCHVYTCVGKMLLAILFYVLGIITILISYNWTGLNCYFKEQPILFWFISIFLSLLGLILSIRAILKRRQTTRPKNLNKRPKKQNNN